MQEIYVNGKKIICNGRNITIINGKVIVDGKEIHKYEVNRYFFSPPKSLYSIEKF